MSSKFANVLIKSVIMSSALFAAAQSARADSSCTSLVASMANQLNTNGGMYDFELTMHRTDVAFISYSKGTLHGTGGAAWPATGSANQLFSDRKSGTQPFNINNADTITPWISSTGQLFIFYNTWNFSTTWDMSCSGSTFTQNVPGVGIVSLTLRSWHT
jgi:hypothetical protein